MQSLRHGDPSGQGGVGPRKGAQPVAGSQRIDPGPQLGDVHRLERRAADRQQIIGPIGAVALRADARTGRGLVQA